MRTTTAGEQGSGLLAAAVRRHWGIVLACVLAFIALGVAGASLQPVSYASVSTLLINPVVGAPFSPETRGAQVNLETEARLVGTPAIAALVEQRLGRDADTLRSNVSAAVPTSTQLLEITYTSSSAERAREGAQAYAESFLQYRAERAAEVAQRELEVIAGQRTDLEQQLTEAMELLAAVDEEDEAGPGEQSFFNDRVTSLNEQLAALDAAARELAESDSDPGQIVTPATEPQRAGVVTGGLVVAAAAAAGLLLGLVLAVARERFDDRIRELGQLTAMGVRVLAHLPVRPPDGEEPVTLSDPDGTASEVYRRLRTAVVTASPQGVTSLVIADLSRGGSAAAPAANLAVVLARMGEEVVVVDAESTAAVSTSEVLGVDTTRGLSDVLLHGVPPGEVLQPTSLDRLYVLAGGPAREAASDRFLGVEMRDTLLALRKRARWLVIAASDALSADGEALAASTDAFVLVVELGRSTFTELEAALSELERLGVSLLGIIATPAAPARRWGTWRRTAQGPPSRSPRHDAAADNTVAVNY